MPRRKKTQEHRPCETRNLPEDGRPEYDARDHFGYHSRLTNTTKKKAESPRDNDNEASLDNKQYNGTCGSSVSRTKIGAGFVHDPHLAGLTATGLLLLELSRILPLACFAGVGEGTTKEEAIVFPATAVMTLVNVTRGALAAWVTDAMMRLLGGGGGVDHRALARAATVIEPCWPAQGRANQSWSTNVPLPSSNQSSSGSISPVGLTT
jgi:hypothetical protein